MPELPRGPGRLPGPEFARERVAELRRGRFTLAAWRRFFGQAWERSREALREEPSRIPSVLGWAIFAGGLGAAVLLVAASARPDAGWTLTAVLWGIWWLAVVALVLLVLDMLENEEGVRHRRFHLPNGLTFIRLSHAPLVGSVLSAAGTSSQQGRVLCVYLALVAGTDLVDGMLARALHRTSRLGSMLDTLADMALLVALATGLHRHGMIPTSLLVLLWARYPGGLVGTFAVGFWRGPLPLRHTLVGRATSFSASLVLVAAAVVLLAAPRWLPRAWVETATPALTGLVGINIVYLFYRAYRATRD